MPPPRPGTGTGTGTASAPRSPAASARAGPGRRLRRERPAATQRALTGLRNEPAGGEAAGAGSGGDEERHAPGRKDAHTDLVREGVQRRA